MRAIRGKISFYLNTKILPLWDNIFCANCLHSHYTTTCANSVGTIISALLNIYRANKIRIKIRARICTIVALINSCFITRAINYHRHSTPPLHTTDIYI